jgi:mannobiose 2-epimerase
VGQVDRVVDTDKEWWPQAEAIVGFVNAYQIGGGAEFLDAAVATWEFTKHHLLDMKNGEWHRRVSRDGALRPGHEKIGPWKCPYHTSRACLEVMERSREVTPVAMRAS